MSAGWRSTRPLCTRRRSSKSGSLGLNEQTGKPGRELTERVWHCRPHQSWPEGVQCSTAERRRGLPQRHRAHGVSAVQRAPAEPAAKPRGRDWEPRGMSHAGSQWLIPRGSQPWRATAPRSASAGAAARRVRTDLRNRIHKSRNPRILPCTRSAAVTLWLESTMTLRELNRATLARQMLLARERRPVVKAVEQLLGLQAQLPRPAIHRAVVAPPGLHPRGPRRGASASAPWCAARRCAARST